MRSSSQPTRAVLKKVSPELLTILELGIRLREHGLESVDGRLRHGDRSRARRCDNAASAAATSQIALTQAVIIPNAITAPHMIASIHGDVIRTLGPV